MPFLKNLLATVWIAVAAPLQASSIQFEKLPIDEALRKAKVEGKFIFVDFYASWCAPCRKMEQEVFVDDQVGNYFNEHFISIRVDTESEQQAYVEATNVSALPTLLFYDPKGRVVYRNEGYMSAQQLLEVAESLVNLNDRLADYQKNDRKTENVHSYAMSMRWVSPTKARAAARKYLVQLDEKKYNEEMNWELIDTYVDPMDRVLFPRVAKSTLLQENRKVGYAAFMEKSMHKLLEYAIKRKNSSILRGRERYIKTYHTFLSDKDSLLLMGNLLYAAEHEVEDYPNLMRTYVEKYVSASSSNYSLIAYELSNKYFQESVLDYAKELANKSIELEPNLYAYLALSNLHERLIEYKAAYAYLLLAYQYADDEQQDALSTLEKELKAKMEFELRSGVSLVENLEDDGRFTLGAGTQRLMYGYPVPQSTSHFIINVNGKLGSNTTSRPGLDKLKGVTKYSGAAGTPKVVTTYDYGGVSITQTLMPVNKEGEEITEGLAQYYKVSYALKTDKVRTSKIGLMVLFDTMMDDNDACPISADGRLIKKEVGFRGKTIPNELLFYRTENDTSDLVGSALLSDWEATTPDAMIIGRWPYLHKVNWGLRPESVPYGDSAYILLWENKSLNSRNELSFVTYYGLPHWKKPMFAIDHEK